MNIAIIIDDPAGVDYVLEQLKDPRETEGFSGMKCYGGTYRDREVSVFSFPSSHDAFGLRVEDLFVFRDFDVLINLGYCYSLDRNAFESGDLVFLSNVKCDDDYRALISSSDVFVKHHDLDKKLEKKIMDVSRKMEIPVFPANCFSSVSLMDKRISGVRPPAPLVDLKAFSLYETASIHNRHAVCLYVVKSIELHDSESVFDNLNRLSTVALEFLSRCSQ